MLFCAPVVLNNSLIQLTQRLGKEVLIISGVNNRAVVLTNECQNRKDFLAEAMSSFQSPVRPSLAKLIPELSKTCHREKAAKSALCPLLQV